MLILYINWKICPSLGVLSGHFWTISYHISFIKLNKFEMNHQFELTFVLDDSQKFVLAYISASLCDLHKWNSKHFLFLIKPVKMFSYLLFMCSIFSCLFFSMSNCMSKSLLLSYIFYLKSSNSLSAFYNISFCFDLTIKLPYIYICIFKTFLTYF